jgi:hypothetical protein
VGERRVADEAPGATAAVTPEWRDGASAIGIVSILLAARRLNRRRRDDAGRDDAWGSLMRHFLPPSPVARLARGVTQPTAALVLVPSPGRAQRRLSRLHATGTPAIAITAIAVAAEEEDAAALGARADDQPKRVQAPPRSGGQAGHSRGVMR